MSTTISYPVTIISEPSDVKTKQNGSTYVSVIVEFKDLKHPETQEPIKTFANFTLTNKDGQSREMLEKGAECVVYHTTFVSDRGDTAGQTLHHFEIGRNSVAITDKSVLDGIFGV